MPNGKRIGNSSICGLNKLDFDRASFIFFGDHREGKSLGPLRDARSGGNGIVLLCQHGACANDIHADQSPVLCTWGIYVEIAKYGAVCELDEMRDFLDALDANIARMDGFILRNSDFTREELDAWQVMQPDRGPDICEAESEMKDMFESFLEIPIEKMNSQIGELLAADRLLLADPCL